MWNVKRRQRLLYLAHPGYCVVTHYCWQPWATAVVLLQWLYQLIAANSSEWGGWSNQNAATVLTHNSNRQLSPLGNCVSCLRAHALEVLTSARPHLCKCKRYFTPQAVTLSLSHYCNRHHDSCRLFAKGKPEERLRNCMYTCYFSSAVAVFLSLWVWVRLKGSNCWRRTANHKLI